MIPEMQWQHNAEVQAARQMSGWREFHAACATQKLFFDHIEKHGGRFVGIAVMGSGEAKKVAEAREKTPIAALTAAYQQAGLRVAAAEPWLELLNHPAQSSDFDDLIADDFEELL